MSDRDPADLDWLASRYLIDELDPTERQRFEDRLGDDLELCEALARATRLHAVTAAALRNPVTEPIATSAPLRPGTTRRLAFSAIALGLVFGCGLAAGLFSRADRFADPTVADGSATSQDSLPDRLSVPAVDRLVTGWSQSAVLVAVGDDADTASDFDSDSEPIDGTDPLTVPNWMLSAVREPNAGDDDHGT